MKPEQELPEISLGEAEKHLANMIEKRRECIEIWNRAIRAAKKVVEARRNAVRSGCLQPELLYMMQELDKREGRGAGQTKERRARP